MCTCGCACQRLSREHLFHSYPSLKQRHYRHTVCVCGVEVEEEGCEVLVNNAELGHLNTTVGYDEM